MSALLLYLTTAAVLFWLANRFVTPLSKLAMLLLALLPGCFVGRALITGGVYAPVDLPFLTEPFRSLPQGANFRNPHIGILSDLVCQVVPWNAAVRWAYGNHTWPLINPFMYCGDLLAGVAQPAAYSPFTLLGLLIPLRAGVTYSAAIAFFVAGLSAFLFARELECRESVALVAATGWMFSTGLAFYILWPIGFTWCIFPLVLLGVRRVVRFPGIRAAAILTVAFVLTILAGHPESVVHSVVVAFVYGVFELATTRAPKMRAIGAAVAAGAIALAICAIYLLPLYEATLQSQEYKARKQIFARMKHGDPPARVAARLMNVFLPFTYQRNFVNPDLKDIPPETAGTGAIVIALALYAIARVRSRTSWFFAALLVVTLLAGVAWPPLLALLHKLPLLDIALNERFALVAAFAFSILAALGLEEIARRGGDRIAGITVAILFVLLAAGSYWINVVNMLAEWVPEWAPNRLWGDLVPLALLAILLFFRRIPPRVAIPLVLGLLLVQRTVEEGSVYPTIPARAAYPPVPIFEPLAKIDEPFRIAGVGGTLMPDTAAVYGLEDPRGYEALTSLRLAETIPLWSVTQPVWFNRIDDPTRPFLSFLNVRFFVLRTTDRLPAGWRVVARQPGSLLAENPNALGRAFVPHRVRLGLPYRATLDDMAEESDFGDRSWIQIRDQFGELENGPGRVVTRRNGNGFDLTADMTRGGWVVISQAAWKGWRAYIDGTRTSIYFANSAFLGVNVPQGHHDVQLRYRPDSFVYGEIISFTTLALLAIAATVAFVRARRAQAMLTKLA